MTKENNDEGNTYFWTGISGGLIVGVLSIYIIFGLLGDQQDVINTEQLGIQLCEANNLLYDHREIDQYSVPIIYCKQNSTEKVIDGIVKVI